MEEKRKVKITYKDINDLEIKYATGAVGGITSSKLISMNFFLDTVHMSKVVMQEVNEDLSLGEEIHENPKDTLSIIREIHTSIQFNVDNAKAFVDWINKRIEEIKQYDEKNSK